MSATAASGTTRVRPVFWVDFNQSWGDNYWTVISEFERLAWDIHVGSEVILDDPGLRFGGVVIAMRPTPFAEGHWVIEVDGDEYQTYEAP